MNREYKNSQHIPPHYPSPDKGMVSKNKEMNNETYEVQ